MKIETKGENYFVTLKKLSEDEKKELIRKVGIIPKKLNHLISFYVELFLYNLKDANEIVCIKSEKDKKDIICLKLEYDQKTSSIKCIGIELTDDKNRVNLNIFTLKKVKAIIKYNTVDDELLLHPILISFI